MGASSPESISSSPEALRGPDSPTLAERFVLAFRLPYPVGCFLVGFFLFGVLDVALTKYAETANLAPTVAKALAPVSLLTDLLVAYSFYAPRYMRRRLVETGRALSNLLPDRDADFHRIFAEVAAPRPQVVAWMLFLVALLAALSVPAILGTGPSPFVFNAGAGTALEFVAGVFSIVSLAVATLALSSVVWTFWSISLGIHRFGQAPLALRPYYEDPFLGLKSLGALSLSRLVGLGVVAWVMSPKLAFVGLVALPLGMLPAYWLGHRITQAARRQRQATVTLHDSFLELSSGIRVIKVTVPRPVCSIVRVSSAVPCTGRWCGKRRVAAWGACCLSSFPGSV